MDGPILALALHVIAAALATKGVVLGDFDVAAGGEAFAFAEDLPGGLGDLQIVVRPARDVVVFRLHLDCVVSSDDLDRVRATIDSGPGAPTLHLAPHGLVVQTTCTFEPPSGFVDRVVDRFDAVVAAAGKIV